MNIREMGRLLRMGKISCGELVEDALEKANGAGKELNAFITLDPDGAMAMAVERDRELSAGIDRGPLHGIPTAHKDLFFTRHLRTTGGSLLYRDFVPDHDAAAVEKLIMAGATSIGKANLHELAYGITSKNPHYGYVHNARDTARIAGGSSGGSATAIAAGIIPMSLGTDTGGSIRVPASYCGVTGIKPTYGRVSRYGVLPLAFSFDHVGPLGTCVEDCAVTLYAIAGRDSRDASSSVEPVPAYSAEPQKHLDGLKIGVPGNFFFTGIDAEVEASVTAAIAALEKLGAAAIEIKVPDIAAINATQLVIQLAEVSAVYINEHDDSRFSPQIWNLLEQGRLIQATEYVNAQRLRTVFRREFNAVWKQVHVLVVPLTPVTAPLLTDTSIIINGVEEDVRMASTRFMRTANLLGDPALAMPCGKSKAGLPIGLQLIGAAFSEPLLFRVAGTLEEAIR